MKQSPLFSNIQTGEAVYDDVDHATYKGITVKTVILLLIAVLIAAVVAFALPTILANNEITFYITLGRSPVVSPMLRILPMAMWSKYSSTSLQDSTT